MKVDFFGSKKPLHIFYFPVWFVLNHFFAIATPANINSVESIWSWSFNLLGGIVFCTVVYVIFYKSLSLRLNSLKSALITSIILFPVFFFQDIFLSAEQLTSVGLRVRWVLPFFFTLLIAACYWIIKADRSFFSVNQFFNVLSLTLLLYTGVTVFFTFAKKAPHVLSYVAPTYSLDCKDCPDIYLLVLDSYTSNKSLRSYFHYDNSDFCKQLEALGFAVADQARSSYTQTAYSLSSILNLDSVKNLSQYNYGLKDAIEKNSVVKSLKKSGYEIHNYSLFAVDNTPEYYSITPSVSIGFLDGIIQSSIFNMVFDFLLKQKLYKIHRDVLRKMSSHDNPHKPKFIYGHLLAPHPPFVIDENGEEISFLNQTRNGNNTIAYLSQIKGLNKMVYTAVRNILQTSPNAIIIITGDHGYRYLQGPEKEDESFTVFQAYRGPNKQDLPYMVNSNHIFQLVFNGINATK